MSARVSMHFFLYVFRCSAELVLQVFLITTFLMYIISTAHIGMPMYEFVGMCHSHL